jgi:biopolymer transport protein ExbB
MWPIFGLAGLALIVALFKWIGFLFVRSPSNRKLKQLLEAMATGDRAGAEAIARKMPGPAGKMLQAGVEHLGEPRDLIEEVMYESVLKAKLRLNRLVPFIGICAAAAPLLGLLGTVTGIMNTFNLITVFGTGDVRTLSSGISEALITTEYGLIVAIPSLLLHAYLSRKAKAIVDRMETFGIAFMNQVSRMPAAPSPAVAEPAKA